MHNLNTDFLYRNIDIYQDQYNKWLFWGNAHKNTPLHIFGFTVVSVYFSDASEGSFYKNGKRQILREVSENTSK